MSLGTLIPHFFYAILKRLMPPNPDEDPELPSIHPDETLHDVYPWKRAVVLHYYDRETMQQSQVSRIDWYKSDHGFKHEYLVVSLLRPARPVVYIRSERRPSCVRDIRENAISDEDHKALTEGEKRRFRKDMKTEEADLKSLAQTGKMSSLTGVQLSANASKPDSNGRRMASDTVAHVARPNGVRAEETHKAPQLIASYHSFSPPLPLRDYAIIADRVHHQDIKYQMLLKNCYWYADTVMGLVRNLYSPTIQKGNGYLLAGQYLGQRVIYRSHEDTPDVLNLVPVIVEARNAQDSRLIKMEEQNARADREAQRAQTADQRAVAAERRADELARQLREAQEHISRLQ